MLIGLPRVLRVEVASWEKAVIVAAAESVRRKDICLCVSCVLKDRVGDLRLKEAISSERGTRKCL